jgi:hypothetical protein
VEELEDAGIHERLHVGLGKGRAKFPVGALRRLALLQALLKVDIYVGRGIFLRERRGRIAGQVAVTAATEEAAASNSSQGSSNSGNSCCSSSDSSSSSSMICIRTNNS